MDTITAIGRPRPRRSADGALRAARAADPSGQQEVIPAIPVRFALPRNTLLEGDCLAVLRTLPDESVDRLVEQFLEPAQETHEETSPTGRPTLTT
ncbi:MAG TPA: hypothetical protein VIM30_08945 [Candidatus Limnocylindrales bacterium]|jgi:hypothetical protein